MKYVYLTAVLLSALVLIPTVVLAECKVFSIVEYKDHFEAVCVGEPLTAAQKKTQQEAERRQDMENRRQAAQVESRRQQAEAAAARSSAQAEAELKKKAAKPVQPKPAVDRNIINMPRP